MDRKSEVKQHYLKGFSYVKGKVTLPGSKSITNRLILLASLSKNKTILKNYLESDDTKHMVIALKNLGVKIEKDEDSLIVYGSDKSFPVKNCELFLGNAGTAFRPLTAVLALMNGHYKLSGVDRMNERPIKDLVDSLELMGATINYINKDGFPPLKINPISNYLSDEITIKGNVSSQFLTALLMAAPLIQKPVTIKVEGDLISKPYINITLKLLERFGIYYQNQNWHKFILDDVCSYQNPSFIEVEGDASSASYFFGAAAIAGVIEVFGINKKSIQGDIYFLEILKDMGAKITYKDHSVVVEKATVLKGLEVDCKMIPDAAMTLATMALFCEGTTKLTNIASWKVKETDRIIAMQTELLKLGAKVSSTNDSITITPPERINNNIQIDTYDDHRMAMCFSLASLNKNLVIINDPECVKKTYPNYFHDFEKIML
jgi:3-phosphoshikimate 1-carboxyvinyltransferase